MPRQRAWRYGGRTRSERLTNPRLSLDAVQAWIAAHPLLGDAQEPEVELDQAGHFHMVVLVQVAGR
jgi:hypothetical protein